MSDDMYRGFEIDKADYGWSYMHPDFYDGAPDAGVSSVFGGWAASVNEYERIIDELYQEYPEILGD